MKILYVLNSSTYGGMEKHVEDLVRGMIEHNQDVYVWCLEGDVAELYRNYGAKVFTENKIRFEIDPKYISNLVKFLKENNIDVIHAHELKAVANSLIAGKIAKVPVRISHTHTPISEWQSPSILKKLSWVPTHIGYAFEVNLLSSKEIALTQSRKQVKMLEGIFSSKLEVIPNSLPFEQFDVPKKAKTTYRTQILKRHNLPKDAFIFGNIGRVSAEKGIDILVKGFAEFLKHPLNKNQNFYLLLVGGGAMEPTIKELIKELDKEQKGIKDKIIMTGVFDEEDKVKYYSVLDVFVFPTLAEGFGLVLMEAMVSELPIISSDLPVLNEVAEDTVEYFDVGNYLELARKMDTIRNNVIDKKYNVIRSKELVYKKYSMDSFIKSYLNLYIKLLVKSSI